MQFEQLIDNNFGFPEGVDAYVKLPQFGCVVWVDEGELYGCEETDFEAAGTIIEAVANGASYIITAPGTQHFLDRVNFYLGRDFKLAEFAGR